MSIAVSHQESAEKCGSRDQDLPTLPIVTPTAAEDCTVMQDIQHLDHRHLKAAYLEGLACLASLRQAIANLKPVVTTLMKRGVTRAPLVRWGVEAGYREPYVRSLVSKLLCGVGQRRRIAGAGPHSPPEALSSFRAVCRDYGTERAPRLLRAAAQIASKERSPIPTEGLPVSRESLELETSSLSYLR